MALLASYLRQPGSARDFSRIVRDVIRWWGQTRNLFDRIRGVDELPPMRLFRGARDSVPARRQKTWRSTRERAPSKVAPAPRHWLGRGGVRTFDTPCREALARNGAAGRRIQAGP